MAEPSPWADWLEGHRARLDAGCLVRRLRTLRSIDGLRADLEGNQIVLFSSNDYLGLSSHPEVRTAAANAAREQGMGPRAAPLICGHTTEHEGLESDLASLKATEGALLFSTGYSANLAVLTSLADPDTAIFSDELNHASIIDGCRLAGRRGASVRVYRHGDAAHLDELLGSEPAKRRLIVTDSVFSMDGDLAPLREIVELKHRHSALLAVDEAHALLVLGERGGGAAEALGVENEVDVHVGTLGKAIGAQGGFVATTARLKEHILNFGRSYIYSTAPVLPVIAAARAALRVFRGDSSHRARLDGYREILGRKTGIHSKSAIFPLVVGSEERALEAAEALLEKGFLVPAIRPPTVPAGTCRLRITLSAGHEEQEVRRLIRALSELTGD